MYKQEELQDPTFITQQLVSIESVTPNVAEVTEAFATMTQALGFKGEKVTFSEKDTYDVENFYTSIGSGTRHLLLSGHLDVVPAGDEEAWKYPPFKATIEGDKLYGRGAVDMKGGLACYLAASARFLAKYPNFDGRISFLVTGDEEVEAINGTKKLLAWAHERGERWDAALNGEPTSGSKIADAIKIGRRGSLSGTLYIKGKQGHVGYPHLAKNPIASLTPFLQSLLGTPLDNGNENFEPTNLEIIDVATGNKTCNIIPSTVKLSFNIRFNDIWTAAALKEEIVSRLDKANAEINSPDIKYEITWYEGNCDSFLTSDKSFINRLNNAIETITNRKAELSTGGGTSDARFIKDYCPVIEIGVSNETIHAVNECVSLDDLEALTKICEEFMKKFFFGDDFQG